MFFFFTIKTCLHVFLPVQIFILIRVLLIFKQKQELCLSIFTFITKLKFWCICSLQCFLYIPLPTLTPYSSFRCVCAIIERVQLVLLPSQPSGMWACQHSALLQTLITVRSPSRISDCSIWCGRFELTYSCLLSHGTWSPPSCENFPAFSLLAARSGFVLSCLKVGFIQIWGRGGTPANVSSVTYKCTSVYY